MQGMLYCTYEDHKGVHHAVRLAAPKFHFRGETKADVRSKAQKKLGAWLKRAAKGQKS